MTNISRDVIKDLLPLYLAGEVSEDSRRLVAEYLSRDPELARLAEAETTLPLLPQLTKEDELNALIRTRSLLRRLRIAQGVAIFFTLLPLSARSDGENTWWLWSELPQVALVAGVVAVVAWTTYFLYRRRVASAGI